MENLDDLLEYISKWSDTIVEHITRYGVQALIAICILAIASLIARNLARFLLKFCEKRKVDITLSRFFAGFAKLLILIFGIIMALSKIGVEITPFIALLGASAFGFSLAVQGPISNYGSGMVLILTRPFKVGDTLTVQELTGQVDLVNLGTTQLINEDNERITIPNRKVLGEIFTNSYEHKLVEGIVGIAYEADPQQAIDVITQAVSAVDGLDPERPPIVGIDEFADSSINIGYRVWLPVASYHKTRFAVNLAVHQALQNAQINIPFPQRDVHLIQR